MSKKKHTKANLHSGPNMTPMVDIVMCILIFFMLGSTFTVPELYLKSQTPAVDKGGIGVSTGNEKTPAVRNFVNIKKIGSEIVVTAFGKQYAVPAADLSLNDAESRDKAIAEESEKLKVDLGDQLARDFPAKKEQLSDDVQIVIAPEAAVDWQATMMVYSQLINAKFSKIAFAPVKG